MTVEIKDDELPIILERLAASDTMFRQPMTTIRDVSELTEVSPNVIARILGEIRGTDELAELKDRINNHEGRISEVERHVRSSRAKSVSVPQIVTDEESQSRMSQSVLIVAVTLMIVFMVFVSRGARSTSSTTPMGSSEVTIHGHRYIMRGDLELHEIVHGQEVPVSTNDSDTSEAKAILLRSMSMPDR